MIIFNTFQDNKKQIKIQVKIELQKREEFVFFITKQSNTAKNSFIFL